MSTGMRIAFITPYPPMKGGISQHAARLIEAMEGMGHNVDVISWYRQYPSRLYPGEQLAVPRDRRHILGWNNPASWSSARKRVRDADLVVFPWVSPFNGWVLAYIVRGFRDRTVPIVHNVLPHEPQPLSRSMTRFVLRGMPRYVVHSDSVRRQLEDLLGEVEVRQVPHPPSFELVPTPLPDRPPLRLLFLGYVRPYKGVDVLLDAIALLRRRGVDVQGLIAGEDWGIGEDLHAQVRALNLADEVTLDFTYVSDDRIGQLLGECHMVVQPYREASQSGVVPLALTAGRPVVVTRVGGLSESVDEGVNGAIAEPEDPESLADAIMRAAALLDQPVVGGIEVTWVDVAAAVLGT